MYRLKRGVAISHRLSTVIDIFSSTAVRSGASRPRDGPPLRNARTGGEVLRQDGPLRRIVEARGGTPLDRPRGCGPLEAQGPPRRRPREAGRASPEDRLRDADRRTRRGTDSRRPSRPDGERPPREGEGTSLLDVRPQIYGGPSVSSDPMPPQHSHDDYVKSVETMRREKDYFFKEDRESPIPHALRAKFEGLAYYPPDQKYRVRAKLVKDPNPQKVVLATSKGVPRDMIRYGVFGFEIDGTKQGLAAYKSLPSRVITTRTRASSSRSVTRRRGRRRTVPRGTSTSRNFPPTS